MTVEELILDCLKLGLDGEKVDYEWEQDNQGAAILNFEDGHRVRITLEKLS
jgi:hypothetical protein